MDRNHSNATSRRRTTTRLLVLSAAIVAALGLAAIQAQATAPATGVWETPTRPAVWVDSFMPGGTPYQLGYMKDADGWVHFRGSLRADDVEVDYLLQESPLPSGGLDAGPWVPVDAIVTLPEGFRPCNTLSFPVHTSDASSGLTAEPAILFVRPDGEVKIGSYGATDLVSGKYYASYSAPIEAAEFLTTETCPTTTTTTTTTAP